MRRQGCSSASRLLATVGGLGYIGFAPGTWGSLVGWLCGMLATRLMARHVVEMALIVSFPLVAFIAGEAERVMGRRDPSAIILDEVWGMAAVMLVLPWVAASLPLGLVAFLLFRLFDIAKPAPLRRLEQLPGGWGILSDDAGAAAYTILVLWAVRAINS